MKDILTKRDSEFMAKLNTIRVDEDGWYAFVVTVSDDLVGTPVNELRLFSAEDSDFIPAEIAASFGLMPLVNGVMGGLEINNFFGVKLDTLPKQFVALMVLSAGKSITAYIVKIILMLLLGGCSAGAGS